MWAPPRPAIRRLTRARWCCPPDLGTNAAAPADGVEQLPGLCSMDDEAIYGLTVYTWTLGAARR
ncbi:hypothetical protein ACIRVF_42085 [Kitasatospora sp. NPDC101157]|uniref:hypothetical protein n=1 Tax=Kitasatospora sp. NPDC101157 TaxID=3364098 RepID=UPI003827D68C